LEVRVKEIEYIQMRRCYSIGVENLLPLQSQKNKQTRERREEKKISEEGAKYLTLCYYCCWGNIVYVLCPFSVRFVSSSI
jgi:hypothetical protein